MVAAVAKTDWSGLVSASKTSDTFTGWKSDPKTGTLSKVNSLEQDTTADELQGRFLKLLVAQLKNQDPNNPLDNAQVTSQMAQLSTVNGIQGLNDTFKSMSAMMTAGQTLQATPILGRDVMYAGRSVNIQDGPAKLAFELKSAASQVSVQITSASGEVIDNIDMGALKSGTQVLEWDGSDMNGVAMPKGSYNFSVAAKNANVAVDATTYSVARVNSVSQAGTGAVLQTSQSDSVKFTDVKRVF